MRSAAQSVRPNSSNFGTNMDLQDKLKAADMSNNRIPKDLSMCKFLSGISNCPELRLYTLEESCDGDVKGQPLTPIQPRLLPAVTQEVFQHLSPTVMTRTHAVMSKACAVMIQDHSFKGPCLSIHPDHGELSMLLWNLDKEYGWLMW